MLFRDVVVFARNEGGKFGKLLKEKLAMLFHHFIPFVRNVGGKFLKLLKEKLTLLFRRVVVFARNEGGKFGKVLKEKLTLLFHHFILFVRNVGGNRGNDNDGVGQKAPLSGATFGATGELRRKFKWPYVMNSSVAMHGPIVSGTWIWHHQHSRWHHGYYRTRR